MLLAGIHDGFPDRPFLQLAIAGDGKAIEPRRNAAGDGESLSDSETLAHRSGRDVNAGQDRAGMSVEDALVGPRVAEDRAVEVAELRIDRAERRHGVALAERE